MSSEPRIAHIEYGRQSLTKEWDTKNIVHLISIQWREIVCQYPSNREKLGVDTYFSAQYAGRKCHSEGNMHLVGKKDFVYSWEKEVALSFPAMYAPVGKPQKEIWTQFRKHGWWHLLFQKYMQNEAIIYRKSCKQYE